MLEMLVSVNGELVEVPEEERERLMALDDPMAWPLCDQEIVVDAGSYQCTLQLGHEGNHVAHGVGNVCAVFDDEHGTTISDVFDDGSSTTAGGEEV